MAKQRKVLPARRANAVDNSLLIRSAESLGRMIGSLQRQLDSARQLTLRSDGMKPRANGKAGTDRRAASGKTQRKATTKTAAAKTSSVRKAATGGASRRGSKRRTTKTSRA